MSSFLGQSEAVPDDTQTVSGVKSCAVTLYYSAKFHESVFVRGCVAFKGRIGNEGLLTLLPLSLSLSVAHLISVLSIRIFCGRTDAPGTR